tara:strand:- start:263 stop:484 length:222 start_codon:yes stop_codon:yes gene_type:complete
MAVLSGYGCNVIGPFTPQQMANDTATAAIDAAVKATGGGTAATGVAAANTTALIDIHAFTSLGNHYFLITYTV